MSEGASMIRVSNPVKERVMMTVQNPANVFASCVTVNDLEFEYMVLSSPENVSWDGERSHEDTRRAYAELKRQYEERLEELCPGIFN